MNDFEKLKQLEQEDMIVRKSNENRPKPAPGRKGPSPGAVLASLVILMLIATLGSIAYIYITDCMPNYNRLSFYEKNSELDRDKVYAVYKGELLADRANPVEIDGELYLPFELVKEFIDKYIFWDEAAKRVTITTSTRVIRLTAGKSEYSVNHDTRMLGNAIVERGGSAYIPLSFLEELYNFGFEYAEEYKLLMIDPLGEPKSVGEALKSAKLRHEPDQKSPVLADIDAGGLYTMYGEENGFICVRAENGLVGYTEADNIRIYESVSKRVKLEPEIAYPDKKEINGQITLVWDQVTTVEANSNEDRRIKHTGLDVLSPTWFSFDGDALDGQIISIADKSYVGWAHDNNYQVWALITDNFDSRVSNMVLTDTANREGVISRLLAYVTELGLDGINIDFEMVKKDDADYYILFLRELYPFMKLIGATLSVDMYVPKPHNMYYNREEIAAASDYLIIMGYDEHHATSEVSGPVASIGFVDEGIFETTKLCPPSKTILGIPFYVRVWREENGKVNSRSYSMDRGKAIFDEAGAEFDWLESLGCYYAEYDTVEDGANVTYRVWLEDSRSIEEKLKLVKKYKLAGVAAWKRGLEADGIWRLIDEYN